ncbi:tail structural protein [Enterobacteria phage mEp021]|nr:tail structural protein [Enterobacteria phage mEp021]
MIYTTGTIAINGNTVTGTGTNFSAPLSLIRVGCTLITIGNPVQIFTITERPSGTELSVTPAANPAIPAGTKFSILLSDSISVDGLAQDVAETLRYYQGKETEIAEAIEFFHEFDFNALTTLANQVHTDSAQVSADKAIVQQYKTDSESAKSAAEAAKGQAVLAQTAAETANTNAQAASTAAQGFCDRAEEWAQSVNPDNLLTKAGNLAGLTDKSAARSNLGVGDNSLVKLGALHLNGGESLVLRGAESNELRLSNSLYGADSWVGMTMHKWYEDWTRAGLVRGGGTKLSDYRIHVWKDGISDALFRFLPDQRLISGNSDNPAVNEFQKAPLSDRDHKKEIQYTDGEESYNRVRQWLPVMFKYKESDVQRYGLIAQDLVRIDPEYVHLLPGYAIYEDVKGVDEEGNEVVVDRKEIGYTDDVLSLDSNVLLMDLCAAFVHLLHKVEKLEGK